MKRIPDWAFIFLPALLLLPLVYPYLPEASSLGGHLGALAILLPLFGGLFGIYAERRSEREQDSRKKARWQSGVVLAVVSTILGAAIGAYDQNASSQETLEVSRENTRLAKENLLLETGGDSICYLRVRSNNKQPPTPYLAVHGEYDIPHIKLEILDYRLVAEQREKDPTFTDFDSLVKHYEIGRVAVNSDLFFSRLEYPPKGRASVYRISTVQGQTKSVQLLIIIHNQDGAYIVGYRVFRAENKIGTVYNLKEIKRLRFADSRFKKDEHGKVPLLDYADRYGLNVVE